MARTPNDAVRAVLDRSPLTTAIRADAWDAFHGAKTVDDLAPRLQKLPLSPAVREALRNLKAKHAAGKDAKMLPRESKYGRYGQEMPAKGVMPSVPTDQRSNSTVVSVDAGAQHPATNTAAVSTFIAEHFRHFNAATHGSLSVNRSATPLGLPARVSTR